MTKVVINGCFGGFSLSIKARMDILHRKGKNAFVYHEVNVPRRGYQKVDNYDTSVGEWRYYVLDTDLGDFTVWDDAFSEARFNDVSRNDPDLVAVVENLGDKANGDCAELYVVEVPDDVEWEISEYDGSESVEEVHRSWR